MKKALVFDPYLDTLGGGERYALTFASTLVGLGYQVEIAWEKNGTLLDAEKRFGINLSEIKINPIAYGLLSHGGNLLQRLQFTSKYDLIFFVSDGSIPFLFSKQNLVHFQVPFMNLGGNPFINKIKSLFINKFVYNSNFTRNIIEKTLPKCKGIVLYPPIDTDQFKPGVKENIILSVARFDSPSHSKRQDILISAYKELSPKTRATYRLVLTGGLKGDLSVLDKYTKAAKGYNIEILPNLEFNKLKSLYSRSKIFWHAAGFEIDEEKNPEKVEHFGMTTVEAMAAGCVPIVINKGGQKEIILPNTGFLCSDVGDFVKYTKMIENDKGKIETISQSAIDRSKVFSTKCFYSETTSLLSPN